MTTQVIYIPTGEVYANRKEAKLIMGHANYNKALHEGKMMFVGSFNPIDIII